MICALFWAQQYFAFVQNVTDICLSLTPRAMEHCLTSYFLCLELSVMHRENTTLFLYLKYLSVNILLWLPSDYIFRDLSIDVLNNCILSHPSLVKKRIGIVVNLALSTTYGPNTLLVCSCESCCWMTNWFFHLLSQNLSNEGTIFPSVSTTISYFHLMTSHFHHHFIKTSWFNPPVY